MPTQCKALACYPIIKLGTMLADLPNELLLMVVRGLDHEADLNAFARTNRVFYSLFKDEPYRHAVEYFDEDWGIPGMEWAAKNGKLASIQNLLSAGVTPSMLRGQAHHPVTVAAANGHADAVKLFLEHDAKNSKTDQSTSEIVPWQEDDKTLMGSFGSAFLDSVFYGHESAVKVMLEALNVERLNPIYWCFFLVEAVANGRLSTAKLVLEMGCEFWTDYDHVRGILMYAARQDLRLFELFFEAVPKSLLSDDEIRCYVLETAITHGQKHIALFLEEKGLHHVWLESLEYYRGDICLYFAGWTGKYPEMGLVLLRWINIIDVVEEDKVLENSIRGLTSRGFSHLIRGLAAGGFKELLDSSLKYHLARHGDGTAYQEHLENGLSHAVAFGHLEIASLLLDRGANPNKKDSFLETWTKTSLADALMNGDLAMANLLLDWGADPQLESRPYFSKAVLQAVPEKRIEIIHLFSRRLPFLKPDINSDSHTVFRKVVEQGETMFNLLSECFNLKLDPDNLDHQNAFLSVGRKGDIAMLKTFLDAGFDANLETSDSSPESILLATARAGDQESAEAGVRLLLQYGANINPPEIELKKAPLLCLVSGDIECDSDEGPAVRILSRNGADLLVTDGIGEDVLLAMAMKRSSTENSADVSTLKTLLECFEEQRIPFDQYKDLIAFAASEGQPWAARILWRYYWRHVHPVD